jgi:hypothetical protein
MAKAWELTLYHRNTDGPNFEVKSWNRIEDDDIVKLLSQFQILLAQMLRQENEEIIKELTLTDDDIPF